MTGLPASLVAPPDRRSSLRTLLPWVAIALVAGLLPAGIAVGAPFSWAAIALLAGTIAALLIWFRPGTAVGLLPVLILPPEFGRMFAHEVALLAVAALLVVHGARKRAEWLWRLEAPEAVFAALLLWGVLSGFWSASGWWWMFGVRKASIGFIALWTSWRLGRLVGGRDLRFGITITAMGISAYILIKAATWGVLSSTGWVDRKLSTDVGWGNSNYLAALLVLTLPTALEVALHDRRPAIRLLAWLPMPLAILMMTATASRGGILLVLAIALLSVFRRRASRRTLAFVGVVAVVGVLGAIGPAGSRLISRFTDARELGSIVIRLMYYREGWRRMVAAWPWGLGLGQGLVTVDRLGAIDPHNYWLVVGSELGVVGLSLWVSLLVVLWRSIGKLLHDPAAASAGWTLRLMFVLAFVNCLFEPTFSGLQYQFLFFWIMGSYLGSASTELVPATVDGRSAR